MCPFECKQDCDLTKGETIRSSISFELTILKEGGKVQAWLLSEHVAGEEQSYNSYTFSPSGTFGET